MAAAMAGFVCGYALALIVTPLAAVALVRARAGGGLVAQVMPQGASLIAVSVILHLFAMLTLTALGLLLGMLLNGLEENSPAAGLGSPNRVFTAFILAATAIAVVPLAVASRRLRLPLLAGGLLFAGCFGWLMPYLASWSPIEG
jgi:hypothetical protein